jgi:hypothetical protein
MRINNAGEFFNFVRGNELVGLAPEVTAMVVCVEEFGRMCQCDSIASKTAKQAQCRGLYVAFASKARNYKSILFSKTGDTAITFSIDGQQIVTLNR